MARPQLANGWTAIAHELIEALAASDISGKAHGIVLLVARAAYGNRRKVAIMTSAHIAVKMRTSTQTVRRLLRILIDAKVIYEPLPNAKEIAGLPRKPRRGERVLGVQKDYDRWRWAEARRREDARPPKIVQREIEYLTVPGDVEVPQRDRALSSGSRRALSSGSRNFHKLLPEANVCEPKKVVAKKDTTRAAASTTQTTARDPDLPRAAAFSSYFETELLLSPEAARKAATKLEKALAPVGLAEESADVEREIVLEIHGAAPKSRGAYLASKLRAPAELVDRARRLRAEKAKAQAARDHTAQLNAFQSFQAAFLERAAGRPFRIRGQEDVWRAESSGVAWTGDPRCPRFRELAMVIAEVDNTASDPEVAIDFLELPRVET